MCVDAEDVLHYVPAEEVPEHGLFEVPVKDLKWDDSPCPGSWEHGMEVAVLQPSADVPLPDFWTGTCHARLGGGAAIQQRVSLL